MTIAHDSSPARVMARRRASSSSPQRARGITNTSLLLSSALWLAPVVAGAQVPNLGSPFITNYDAEDHGGNVQSWTAVQDHRGVMYFGNSDGILEFDGHHWRHISGPPDTITRALAIGPDGTIYYGAIGDIGYLTTSATGKLVGVSLLDAVPENDRAFNDVWQIESTSNGIYFLTRTRLFRLAEGKLTTIAGKLASSQATVLNGTLFYSDMEKGICFVDRDRVIPIPQLSELHNKGRVAMTVVGRHELLVVTAAAGFRRVDLSSMWDESAQRYRSVGDPPGDMVRRFPTELDSFHKESQAYIYKLAMIDRDVYAAATIKAGIIIFDRGGKIIRAIDGRNGLLDNTVIGMFVDRSKNLWACTNASLSYVELGVHQSFLGSANGVRGPCTSAHLFNGRLYIGVTQGMVVQSPYRYTMEQSTPQYQAVKGSPHHIWEFLEVDGDLMAATGAGLYQVRGDAATRVMESVTNAYSLGRSRLWPEHLFVGLMGGMDVYERRGGRWAARTRVAGIDESIRRITEDENGDLWLSTEIGGLLLLRLSTGGPTSAAILRFGKEHGLPDTTRVFAVRHGATLYALTRKGLYRAARPPASAAAPEQIRFVPDPVFAEVFNAKPSEVRDMIADGKGGFFFSTSAGILWAARRADGTFELVTRPFRGFQFQTDPLFLLADGGLWIPGNKLNRVDLQRAKDYEQPFAALIRSVTVKSGQTIYSGNVDPKNPVEPPRPRPSGAGHGGGEPAILSYDENAFSFEFAATFYERPGTTTFQYLLDGFDEDWSDWAASTFKEYTNIPEGDYRFRVRAKNLYEIMGKEAEFRFVVLPPWHRTTPAFAAWIAAGCAVVTGIVYFFTRRLRRQKQLLADLVRERTQQLFEVTITDPLTGLRNRRFITSVLQSDVNAFVGTKKYLQASKSSRRTTPGDGVFGLFLIDLDHFKEVNDVHGHEAGDMVLKQLAKLLVSSVRGDDAVIRMGGEEFLVVLKNTEPAYLNTYAAKILEKVSCMHFAVGDAVIHKTCSIGYSSFPVYRRQPDLVTFEQAIKVVDFGMYYAKNNGRNQAVFLREGARTPVDQTAVQRSMASMEYALTAGHLMVGRVIKG